MTASLVRLARELVIDENGAALVEYGLILLLIAGASIAVLTTIGNSLHDIWIKINTATQPHP